MYNFLLYYRSSIKLHMYMYILSNYSMQNAIVKCNILFGRSLSEGLYKRTLADCALEQDLLPGGDDQP